MHNKEEMSTAANGDQTTIQQTERKKASEDTEKEAHEVTHVQSEYDKEMWEMEKLKRYHELMKELNKQILKKRRLEASIKSADRRGNKYKRE